MLEEMEVVVAKPDVLKVHEGIIAYSRYTGWPTKALDAVRDLAAEVERLRREASTVGDSR
jgi:hypothetical protein